MSSRAVLVLTTSDPERLARIRRNVEALAAGGFAVDIASPYGTHTLPVRQHILIDPHRSAAQNRRAQGLTRAAFAAASCMAPKPDLVRILLQGQYGLALIKESIARIRHDLYLVEEVELLPFALELATRNRSRVMVDLRDFNWTLEHKPAFGRRMSHKRQSVLYQTFLPQAHQVLVVSRSQQEQLVAELGVNSKVMLSTPWHVAIEPAAPTPGKVRIVYHGRAEPNRKIEVLLDAMCLLDDSYTLDLFLVPGDHQYIDKLKNHTKCDQRIALRDPVPLSELVSATAGFDVGLAFFPPATSNLASALPNKVFEYVQARLALVTGPTPDIAHLVEAYGCGLVTDDFSAPALAKSLASLDHEALVRLKSASHAAAATLCFEKQAGVLLDAVRHLLQQGVASLDGV